MTSEERKTATTEIAEVLFRDLRKNLEYSLVVTKMLKIVGYDISLPVSTEAAKGFLTALVNATPFTRYREKKIQVALASWALLDADKVVWSNKVKERHAQIVELYDYHGLTGKSTNPKELNHTEDDIYKEIAEYFIEYLVGRHQFFVKAFGGDLPEGMMDADTGSSFPLNNTPREDGEFIGRETLLAEIWQNFNAGESI